MKRFFAAICALVVTSGVMAQTQATKVVTQPIQFKEVKHDFGKIKQGTPVNYDFAFKNVSDKPVVIESATASCGCTTPKWPQAPVSKGKTDKISAGFNAAAVAPFEKTIYVKISGVEQPLELKISGEVLNAEDFAKYQQAPKENKKTRK